MATTGGVGIAIAGPILLATGGGAVAGGFIGAMTTRGFTKEVADYYDRALTKGKTLVAVEDGKERDAGARLDSAERIFTQAGAEPIPLSKG